MKAENLLKSKNYGLGKDNLWSLKIGASLRLAEEVLNENSEDEIKLIPPKTEIHTFKYEHEKACGDVFVTLALTGNLYGWEAHRKISKNIIPDRAADYGGTVYIEVEMGSQNKIRQKSENYSQYFSESRKQCLVWFLVDTDKLYQSGLEDLRDFPRHYSIQKLSEFHSDMLSDTLSD